MKLKTSIQLLYLSGFQKGIRLQTWRQFPCPWTNMSEDVEEYEKTYGDVNYRAILDNEIVIDIDAEYVKCAPVHADLVEEDLNKRRINFSRWLSGGDGIHFHVLFDPVVFLPLVKKYGYTKVKEKFLLSIISEENINPKNIDSHVCFGNNRLICLEYTRHKKGKYKTLVKDVFSKKLNDYPDELIAELDEDKNILVKGKAKLKRIRKANPDYALPCEKFILGEDNSLLDVFELKDGLYRLMFIFISLQLKKGLSPSQIFEQAVIWRNSFNPDLLSLSKKNVTDRNIKYMISAGRGEVSCNYITSALTEIGAKKICDSCILKRK